MIYNFDDLAFKPISVAVLKHGDGVFDVMARPFASISFRIAGTGRFEVGGKRIEIGAGDVLFIPMDTPYRAEYSQSVSIVAHLVACNYREAEYISLQNPASVERRFQRMAEAWNESHSVNRARAMIYDILEKMSEDRRTELTDPAFAGCLAYINAHFCDPTLNLQKVCEHNFISMSGLLRRFDESFHVTPKQYLIRLRMNRAIELLTANELSVLEVALACGFSDEKYFSRAFKKRYGYPPSRMKRGLALL